MKPVGKPDAGNPHVRFDERGRETGRHAATALVLDSTTGPFENSGLSATVTDERIFAAIGRGAVIWAIEAEQPHNDVMKRRSDLAEFRRLVRSTLNAIKAAHGERATINLFPALPVSAAVELGRVWMPKADLPLVIYDQNRKLNGFSPALAIGV